LQYKYHKLLSLYNAKHLQIILLNLSSISTRTSVNHVISTPEKVLD
jgi:hypothetical protein